MSSPNINNIINLNCLLLYLCPIFNSIKGLNITNEFLSNSMCQANAWLIPICSTMLYGAMLAKAWRIFKIFDTTPKMKKIVIKDFRLIVYIFIMVSVDLSILFVWQFYDTIKIKLRYLYEIQQSNTQSQQQQQQDLINKNSLNILTTNSPIYFNNTINASIEFNENMFNTMVSTIKKTMSTSTNLTQTTTQIRLLYECNSNFNEVWITVLTIYKIILLMYGIYLSWLIRNVNVPSMNDAKYLLLSTYTIIVCGLGSMTLIQLLRDWPDVVQVFFTIGIVVGTCTTQCLLFIPKIILWYKRRNDDNFKISLSQIFLQSTSSCYYSDKQSRNSANTTNANIINLEDELCELLHENSQLKNSLKEKEEIIKILQEKIKIAKASLFLLNEKVDNKNENSLNFIKNNENNTQTNHIITLSTNSTNLPQKCILSSDSNINSAPSTINRQQKINHHDSGFDIDSTVNTIPNSESQSFENLLISKSKNNKQELESNKVKNMSNENSGLFKNTTIQTEKLKNDLDEVEELTTRVRDSISIDLSSTRRYSPLLYEYYRKQIELAKSIQSTYNIQCNTLFDAMTLMRRCLKDYCQSVHNPEYFAIDSFQSTKQNQSIFQTKSTPISNLTTYFDPKNSIPIQNPLLNLNKSLSFNNQNTVNKQIKNILSSNTFNHRNKNDSANNTFLSSENTSVRTSTTSSPSAISSPPTNLPSNTQLGNKLSIENKQTYV